MPKYKWEIESSSKEEPGMLMAGTRSRRMWNVDKLNMRPKEHGDVVSQQAPH